MGASKHLDGNPSRDLRQRQKRGAPREAVHQDMVLGDSRDLEQNLWALNFDLDSK